MDIIRIKDLEVYANHGVLPEERILGQKFLISAVIYMDFSKAALSGNLDKTINYASVCQFISEFTQENTFELIETLAEGIALEVLDNFPLAERVDIEVKKPWAPIGLPVNTVSVEVSRSRHTVYIALGSNMGYKEGFLWGAVDALNALDDFKVTKVSDFIETEPYGGVEQDDFLNGVLEGETTMTPLQLLEALNNIEESAGRTRDVRWGPRTLDLDIIFYDDEIIDSEILVIPHKDMHRRDFVLAPMKQSAPWKRHPVTGKTIEEMYESVRTRIPVHLHASLRRCAYEWEICMIPIEIAKICCWSQQSFTMTGVQKNLPILQISLLSSLTQLAIHYMKKAVAYFKDLQEQVRVIQ